MEKNTHALELNKIKIKGPYKVTVIWASLGRGEPVKMRNCV